MRRRSAMLLLAVVAAFSVAFAAGCGDDDGGLSTQPPSPPATPPATAPPATPPATTPPAVPPPVTSTAPTTLQPPSIPTSTAPSITVPTAPTPPSTPPATPPSGDYPNADEQTVLASIPEATRPSCFRSQDSDRASNAVASITCDQTETLGHVAFYESFADKASMDAYYDVWFGRSGATRDQGDCASGGPGERTWNNNTGRVVCFVQDGSTAWMVWTEDTLLIATTAVRRDGNLATLAEWWASPDSGPVAP